MLEAGLLVAVEVQVLFREIHGFQSLSHLLMICDALLITYKLYLRLLAFLDGLRDVQLQSQLFDHILMNIELWLRRSAKDHLRVVKHWS
jgi:hypothetical protein